MSSPQARRGGEPGVRLALLRRHTPGAPSPPAAPHPSAVGKEWSRPGARLPAAVLGSAGQVRWGAGGVLRQTHLCGGGKAHPSHPPGPARAPLAAGSPSFSSLTLGQRPAPQGRAAQSPLKAVGRLGADKGGGKRPINCKRQDKGRRAVGAAAWALWHRTKGGPGAPAQQTLTCASPGAGVLDAQAHSQKGRRQPGSPSGL